MKVTVIRCSGTEEEHEVAWEAIPGLIGTDALDAVNLHDGRVMLVDDYGLIREKRPPFNPAATALYHSVCRPGTTHPIVGDVAIVYDRDN